jgi:hypothetical protein
MALSPRRGVLSHPTKKPGKVCVLRPCALHELAAALVVEHLEATRHDSDAEIASEVAQTRRSKSTGEGAEIRR